MIGSTVGFSSVVDEPSIDSRRSEVEALLGQDETALGLVWRELQSGKSVAEVAEAAETTLGPVYAYQQLAKALADGSVSTSPTVAVRDGSRIRSWLKKKPMSPELRQALESQEQALSAVAADRAAQEAEEEAVTTASRKVEQEAVPGIYVYTLPHYWRYKVDPDNDQTYLKVGKSESDVFSRVSGQRTTALPEDPWLLRVYPTDIAGELERKFHRMLEAADHRRAVSTKGGREWFLTSLRILDWYAQDQGLEIRRLNDESVEKTIGV